MPRRKRITGKELIRTLKKFGFAVVRVQGSHHRLKHPDGRVTTVPVVPPIYMPGRLRTGSRPSRTVIDEAL
jgi:predicted RNA binding protein YcfA (HicA-like mRNA interferase family)